MMKKNPKLDVVTIGGAQQDITYYSKESLIIKNPNKKDLKRQKLLAFEYGAKVVMQDIDYGFGGGACNSAVTFASLGLSTAIIVRLGSDNAGQQIKKALASRKITTKFLQIDKKKLSGFSFIVAAAREKGHSIFIHRGSNTNMVIEPKVIKKLKPKFFYVTSWAQPSWQKEFTKLLRAKGSSKIAWNPGSRQLQSGWAGLAKFLKQIDVFNVNKDEAIELVLSARKKVNKKSLNNPRSLLRLMQDWGPKIIVITDGHRGAYASFNGKIFYVNASGQKKVDTTGAGDAFGSAFVAGLIMFDFNIAKSLKLAAKNSGSVVQKVGAQNGILNKKEATRGLN